MKEIIISSFDEYHNYVTNSSSHLYLFRGVSNSSYELLPSIARKKDSNFNKTEHDLMWLFKSYGLPHIEHIPQNEWEWLCLAQHYRLPTRLLDWTGNPLVALFFAVEDKIDFDGAVYVLRRPYFLIPDEQKSISPFSIEEIKVVLPVHLSLRISTQDAYLTIHPAPIIPYDNDDIDKLTIHKNLKKELIKVLDQYGINRMKLFPDLDGISSYLRWKKGFNE
jgi:hypothetical protein